MNRARERISMIMVRIDRGRERISMRMVCINTMTPGSSSSQSMHPEHFSLMLLKFASDAQKVATKVNRKQNSATQQQTPVDFPVDIVVDIA